MSTFFVIYLVVLLVGHVLVFLRTGRERRASEEGTLSEGSRAWIGVLVTSDAFPVGLYVLVMSIFELHWYLKLAYVLAGLLALALPLGLLTHWFTWKRFGAWCLCALLVAGGIWGSARYDSYQESITLPETFDYRSYEPFRTGSLAKSLDEEPSLRFSTSDRLPRLDGATALYPVYASVCQTVYPPSLGNAASEHYHKIIDCNTTTRAYKRIVDGDCDMIFVAGPSQEQEAYAAEQGVELVYTPIGREAFVFFVHPENPVDGLSLSQLRGIYSGQITDWEQLGARGLGKILAYQRPEGSGSQTALERFVMGDTPLMPADREKIMTGMGDIVEQVSAYKNNPNAIGYSFRFYCTELMRGFRVKLLEVDGIAPTVENIENGSYPLANSFYAVTRSDADENTLALVEWLRSEQGKELIRLTGYTPMPEE